MCGIYGIFNVKREKWYVGQAKNIDERLNKHFERLRDNRHTNKGFQSDYNTDGEQAFECNILEECEASELDAKEIAWIEKLNSLENGYNLTAGGKGSKGRVISDETRRKMSEWQKGEKGYWYGKKRPEEFRQAIIKANTGRPVSEETRDKLRIANTGKKHSEESRKKMSESRKGVHLSEEHKRHISESRKGQKGQPLSEEHYEALKAASIAARSIRIRCNETGEEFVSLTDAVKKTGVNINSLSACLKGKRKHAGGYTWSKI